MICQQCGAPLSAEDRFCAVCAFGIAPHPDWPPPLAPLPPTMRPRRRLAGFLVSFQDDPTGTVWTLRRGRNTIGRSHTEQELDIAVPVGMIGSFHAIIDCDEHRFLLSDAESPSGTFLNEEAIGYGGQREVRDGDMIRFGGYEVMVVSLLGRPWRGR